MLESLPIPKTQVPPVFHYAIISLTLGSSFERKTRFYCALNKSDHTVHSMEIAFGVVASQYPQGIF